MADFTVEDTFVITGRGVVVTGKSDGLIELGDTYTLDDGTEFTVRGIERWGIMLGKPPKKDEQIGVLLGDVDRDLVPKGTVLHRGQPSITCPRCSRTSYHPEDIKQGYCGFCHWWTSDSQLGQPGVIAQAESEGAIMPLPGAERPKKHSRGWWRRRGVT